MTHLEERNQKIINAIIEKANVVCPGALALLGINGSFMTGDFHEKSDLDLLIVINDDRGWQLGCTFIQDDLQVGHDIYCINWEQLRNIALYQHPNISKLMDSKIVYCADEIYIQELEKLREQVRVMLSAPFNNEDYSRAEKLLKEAEHYYAMAMISENMLEVLDCAGGAIYYIENAIAMINKQYFHLGVKRAYEELNAMKNRPENLDQMIDDVIMATSVDSVKEHLTKLMKETIVVFRNVKETINAKRKPVTADELVETYEEMFSNWRNKMYVAAENDNVHLAFMSLISSNAMFSEIYENVDVARYNALGGYNSQDLHETAESYEDVINEYLKEYRKVGIQEKRYSDIDEFVLDYVPKDERI